MKTNLYFLQKVLIALIVLVTVTNCKKEVPFDGYKISGNVKGLDSGWVKIIRPNYVRKSSVIDSVQMHHGTFELKGKVDTIDLVTLTIDEKYRTMRGFFLDNSALTLDVDLTKADEYGQFEPVVSGSKYQVEFEKQEAKTKAAFDQEKYAPLVAFSEQIQNAYKSKDSILIAQLMKRGDSLGELMEARQKEYQMNKINYVKDHPDSPVAPNILGFQFSEGRMSKEQMGEIFPLFNGDAKKTAMYQYYAKIYDEIFNSLGVGARAPDFILNTLEGNKLTLSKVDAKYKLVDFWASWCVPCRASFPHLKDLYTKYQKDGFEIVGIGTSDEEAKWRKAIEEDQTPWQHVYDNSEEHAYGKVAIAYGVPFLPTTFLLDENEEIVLRNPTKKELDAKLKELFGY